MRARQARPSACGCCSPFWVKVAGKRDNFPQLDAPSFKDIVCFLCQAEPDRIRLVISGVARTRCVLKGAVHAKNLGFKEVIVVDELVRRPRWHSHSELSRRVARGLRRNGMEWNGWCAWQAEGGGVDRWRAGTREQCKASQAAVAAAEAGGAKAEGRFNAPLPSPSSYFGDKFKQGNEEQMKEWREQVYKGYKGGPSIVHANKILEQAGAVILQQADLQKLLVKVATTTGARSSAPPEDESGSEEGGEALPRMVAHDVEKVPVALRGTRRDVRGPDSGRGCERGAKSIG
jgi:hypothetical protein